MRLLALTGAGASESKTCFRMKMRSLGVGWRLKLDSTKSGEARFSSTPALEEANRKLVFE